ncbi:MAG: cytochrome oxidase Cu insertion factor (SCO1/SenC/PrrC family) [Cellvibrionaceae bacterium]|jgi:cytochrome oxidase Cu insertion factor (SCO1/SenC/PrrC family)
MPILLFKNVVSLTKAYGFIVEKPSYCHLFFMKLRKIVIASVLILLALSLMPILMLINQWASDTEAYGITGNDGQQIHFRWQDVNQQVHRYPASAGTYTYLFLGFLSCSEICPIRIEQLDQLEQRIEQDASINKAEVQFMFVTIDPDNDTLGVRQAVIDARSKRFVSASLSESDSHQLELRLSDNINRQLETINHVGNLFLLDPYGKIARIYTAKQLSTSKMLIDLNHIISTQH